MANYVWLIFNVLLSCATAQKIELKDFSYKDNETSCTNVLISGYDVVEFTCVVDYSHDADLDYVIFQTKMASEDRFIFFTDCNIKEHCQDSRNAHGRQISKDIIEITIRLNATTSLNGAKLRGLLYTPDLKTIYSSEKIFPVIKDLTEAEGKLIINGKIITPLTECHEVVQRSELNLVFLCESQGLPYLIEISTDGSNETNQGVGHATWNKKYPPQTEINVLINYGVCNLKRNYKSVSCKLKFEYTSTTNASASINDQRLRTIFLLLGAMMIMILLCMLLKRYKKKIFLYFSGVRFQKSKKLNQSFKFHETETRLTGQLLIQDCPSCQKTEKHESCIPILELSEKDLPPKYDMIDLYDLIKCISELTVKVNVNHNSYPGTDHTYPLHEKRGPYDTRFGTGLIESVALTENGQPCPCYKCLHSGNASKEWGKICIATSKSLVFDDSEVQKTTFEINFKDENGSSHCIDGTCVTQSDIDTDQCEVECVTCDKNLLKMLDLKPQKCMLKMADANSKYNKFKDKDQLTIIVSHPHDCPKTVSIGQWTKRVVVETVGSRQYTKYFYNAPTSQGCIGAFVYILGASDISLKHHVHCGVNEEMNSFSSIGMEEIRMEMK